MVTVLNVNKACDEHLKEAGNEWISAESLKMTSLSGDASANNVKSLRWVGTYKNGLYVRKL